MVLDQEHAAGLERIEHRLVERRDVGGRRARRGIVEVMVVLAGPDHIQRLGRSQRCAGVGRHHHVGADRLAGVDQLRTGLGQAFGPQRIDLAVGADGLAQQPGIIAPAGDQLANLLTGLDAREGHDVARLASGVAGCVGGRTAGVGHGGGYISGRTRSERLSGGNGGAEADREQCKQSMSTHDFLPWLFAI